MTEVPRTLGERAAGVDYKVRPAAYLVALDDRGRVALVWTGRLYFLPGGGTESGETPEEAAGRETLEETGHAMRILRPLGAVTEFIQSREDGLFYEVRGDYFLGELGERLADPVEPDHELHWFAPDVAVEKLHRPGHIDAVRRALGQNK